MDEQETRKAITFFHNLNLILHYQTDELDMLVFVELKPILDLVSLLIGSSFINEGTRRIYMISLVTSMWTFLLVQTSQGALPTAWLL